MQVHLLGVRGSTPAPGAAFTKYGGHTSCVAIAHDGQAPALVLDAGTGLRRLSALLGTAAFHGTILLGHLHLDHHMGLPFFANGDRDDSNVEVLLPAQGHADPDARATLERAFSPPHFPITPAELRGDWRFRALDEGMHRFEGFDVLALEIPHKGGRTFGFRVDDGTASVAYLSDHSPTRIGPGTTGNGALHEAAMTLAAGVDLLIHDAQYTREEFPPRSEFGHCTIDYALELATAAGARRLLLFHHDPARTDDHIDLLVGALPAIGIPISAAREGETLVFPEPVTGLA